MVLRQVWVGTFDLDEALAADGLVAAARPVQVWGIIQEADRTLGCILVEKDFDWLAIDEGVMRKRYFPWGNIRLGRIPGPNAQCCGQCLCSGLEGRAGSWRVGRYRRGQSGARV